MRAQISGWVIETNVWNQNKQPNDEGCAQSEGYFECCKNGHSSLKLFLN